METNFNEIAKLKDFKAREVALKQYIVSDVYNRPVIALYVSTYAKYSAGYLTGAWINLQTCEDKETFLKVCRALHGDEQYPEFMFQDFSGFPRELYSECGGLDDLYKYIEVLESVDEPEALAAFLEYFDFDELGDFEDRYRGSYDSEVDYAYECIENDNILDKMGKFAPYFDYEAYARDLFLNDYVLKSGYVFYKGRLR